VRIDLTALARTVLGRRPDQEYFRDDCQVRSEQLTEALRDRRILVIGGAGSIGGETVALLAAFQPTSLHVVDVNENALAELVRDLRSRGTGLKVPDFRALPLDFGSPVMRRFLAEEDPYDLVLNFAALKHVRSEKDICSLLQLLDTNVLKVARLLRWMYEGGATSRFFSVSTDKAANPVSLMGASKRLMEEVAFTATEKGVAVSSARFANVAFSNGSLLASFITRLAKRQPLAAPVDTRRFFVTLEEAGRLCLLAAVSCPGGHIVVPGAEFRAVDHRLEDVAVAFLRAHGLQARIYEDEAAARLGVETDLAVDRYPLLLTRRDTSGEKAYEEFVGDGEQTVSLGFHELEGIPFRSAANMEGHRAFLSELEALVGDPARDVKKADLIESMRTVLPGLAHVETGKTLDGRM
jgi:FlaA1/EpsC-like NDP-sugar epimerase